MIQEITYEVALATYRRLMQQPVTPEILKQKEKLARQIKAKGWLGRACQDLGITLP